MHRLAILFALMLCACASRPVPLTASDHARLETLAQSPGTHIYDGSVSPLGTAEPVFRYQRWVEKDGSQRRSTHVTYDLAGRLIMAQRATHDADYRLRSFEDLNRQTGVVSRVLVDAHGGLRFVRRRAGEEDVTQEGPGAPVVVGPTLFGFVSRHLDRLLAREIIDIRFAAAERGESFRFELRLLSSEGPVIQLAAKSAFVRLAIAPMRIVFEDGAVVRYEGRVPPLLDGDTLDARVDYTMVADVYR